MTAVATLAIAADPYLAAAEAHARSCGYYGPERNLTAGQAASLIARRAEEPAFKAAVDAATAAERLRTEQARVALRHWRLEAERQQRINAGALAILAGIDPQAGPGHLAKELGDLRTWLEDSRGYAVFADPPTLNDFAD